MNDVMQGVICSECAGEGVPIRQLDSNSFDFGEKAQFFISVCTGRDFWKFFPKKDRAIAVNTYRSCIAIITSLYGTNNMKDIKNRVIKTLRKNGFFYQKNIKFLKKHKNLSPKGWVKR